MKIQKLFELLKKEKMLLLSVVIILVCALYLGHMLKLLIP